MNNQAIWQSYQCKKAFDGIKVNKLGLVKIDGCTYSVQKQFIGSRLDVVINKRVSVYYEDHLIDLYPETDLYNGRIIVG